jgi:hypothetical protein
MIGDSKNQRKNDRIVLSDSSRILISSPNEILLVFFKIYLK